MKRYILIAGVNGAGKTTFYSTEEKFGDLIKINFDETVRCWKWCLCTCTFEIDKCPIFEKRVDFLDNISDSIIRG